jgi:hypothetical protein
LTLQQRRIWIPDKLNPVDRLSACKLQASSAGQEQLRIFSASQSEGKFYYAFLA